MKAMVFAAGLGTRLKPITDTIPKALVPVGGIPMLERVILKLKAAGISDFVVNTCYFADKVEDFLHEKENFGVRIAVSREAGPELVGTIGGQTAVANNDQIVEAVSRGVAVAVAQVLGSGRQNSSREVVLNVNGREFCRAILGDLNAATSEKGISLVNA